jgi:hypothetical protein
VNFLLTLDALVSAVLALQAVDLTKSDKILHLIHVCSPLIKTKERPVAAAFFSAAGMRMEQKDLLPATIFI